MALKCSMKGFGLTTMMCNCLLTVQVVMVLALASILLVDGHVSNGPIVGMQTAHARRNNGPSVAPSIIL